MAQIWVLLGAPTILKNPYFAPLIIFFKRKVVVPPRLRFRLCFFAFFLLWSLLAYLLSVFFPVWSRCCVKVWFFEAVRGLVLLCSWNVLFSFLLLVFVSYFSFSFKVCFTMIAPTVPNSIIRSLTNVIQKMVPVMPFVSSSSRPQVCYEISKSNSLLQCSFQIWKE